jgi:hypothetical protein
MSASLNSIPASKYVSVIPGVLGAGGNALQLNGLFLDSTTRVPVGQVLSFASPASVLAYFGAGTPAYSAAQVYFAGFTNCTALPGAMLVTQFPTSSVAAYLRGGSLSGVTLAQLQAFTGTIVIVVNGTSATSGTINLSSATSFSNAATIIQTAFTAPPFTVTYDSVASAFVFTSSTAGTGSTVAFPTTGTLATELALTQAAGAVLSQGAAVSTPAAFMTAVTGITQNWACFTTLFNPDTGGANTQKLAFAAWTNGQNNRYAYVPWDSDVAATQQGTTTSLGYLLERNDYSGTCPVYETGAQYLATFVLGFAASLNFAQTDGRQTLAYRSQPGLTASVTNQQISDNLDANGYNYHAAVATANQSFTFMQSGLISGPFLWFDSYVNQIWMNSQFQLALMELEVTDGNIPYNAYGDALIESALLTPIQAALNYGAIRSGGTLSALQLQEIDNAVGVTGAGLAVQNVGYYLLIGTASPQVQAARGSPPIFLYYFDGQSVQTLSMNSVDVE